MADDVMTKEKVIIVYLGDDPHVISGLESDASIESHRFANGIAFKKCLKELDEIHLVLVDKDLKGLNGIRLIQWLNEGQDGKRLYYAQTGGSGVRPHDRKQLLNAGVVEYFPKPFDTVILKKSLQTIRRFKEKEAEAADHSELYDGHLYPRISIGKRIFDILISSIALVIVAPLFLIVSLLIKLEAGGPVFYVSKRVGTGYKVFDFYKFRSMRPDADRILGEYLELNGYEQEEQSAPVEQRQQDPFDTSSSPELIHPDGSKLSEREYLELKRNSSRGEFIKLKNDPRVTRIGHFIRRTSIDELPQMFNVLKGDMSIVGNRPLPLYEAEQLTSDLWSLRFMAPAGITGLWQVKRNEKKDMTAEERKLLDNQYAKDHSLSKDIQLIFQTLPALWQKESM
jgi:lipopolysaccharide/colanic/teichoic acid biosynthesis glycosyltransferase